MRYKQIWVDNSVMLGRQSTIQMRNSAKVRNLGTKEIN